MRLHTMRFCLVVLVMLIPATAYSQATFNGLTRVGDWIDFENQSNELPAQVWGSCDVTQEDSVAIVVDFDDGTSGTAVYSGVSGLWNSTFPGLSADASSGFFQSCSGMHFLYNNGTTLPMAWESCSMPFASNFDLDYNESNGSHFRATTTGWVSAHFQTYCGSALATTTSAIPALSASSLIILVALFGLFGVLGTKGLRKRNQHS